MSKRKKLPPVDIGAPDDHIRPDLDKLVAKWKQILRLQDWDITAEYARGYEMEGAFGNCTVSIERNLATIKIMEPGDIDPAVRGDNSIASTLVHEMLHVPCNYFRPERDTLNYQMWERFVDMHSVILVNLARRL